MKARRGKTIRTVLFGSFLMFAATPAISANDGDSNAMAAQGFTAKVKQANGVIIKVPINAQGQELVSAAKIHLNEGERPLNVDEAKAAFDSGTDMTSQPKITPDDISRDSSTWGWYSWYSYSWYNNYFWYYRPYYYYYGSYYRYYNPYYYSYYTFGYPYYGYRYYYYYYYY